MFFNLLEMYEFVGLVRLVCSLYGRIGIIADAISAEQCHSQWFYVRRKAHGETKERSIDEVVPLHGEENIMKE